MRIVLTFLLAAICVVGVAQKKPKKPNINKALTALEAGNLAEAKTIIDLAIEHEKTKDIAKTWFYRGQIYAALDTANNEDGALEASLTAFDKALELDPDEKTISTVDFNTGGIVDVASKKQGIYAYYYNEAIEAYNAEDFEGATDNFETAFFVMPSDSNSVLNAAFAASAYQDNVRAEKNFNKAYEVGVRNKSLFLYLYNYAVTAEDYEKALGVIQNGREAYPDDVDLMKYEINLYLQLEKTDEARTGIEDAIAADPNNADLYFSLGVLKEETGDVDGALESYNKAIEVDPNHFNANFNLSVFTFNKANEMMKERNALSYKEERKINDLSTKIDALLNEALPMWEKLYSLKSSDAQVVETLGFIYTNLKMNDKAEQMADELDAIKGN